MKSLLITIIFTLSSFLSQAKLLLPSFFSNHMVLQRKSEVAFFGTSDVSQTIKVFPSWLTDTIKVRTDACGKWKTALKTPAAGGPYTITVIDVDSKIILEDILIGEVWLCSGQSNMGWSSVEKHQEILDELPTINNPQIRVLQMTRYASEIPQNDIRSTWKTANPESVKGFSSIAYFIAKKLQKELNVPVGVINASWGGTAAEVWTPEEVIKNSPTLSMYAALQREAPSRPHLPGRLWNTMIHPLINYKIAGAYWYQGESNVSTWQGYAPLFSAMINSWRQAWGYEFPFYYVQIAPFDYKTGNANRSAFLREQQAKVLSLPKTGMVVVTDQVTDVKNIHPEKKIEVANRLA
ncbi:MAG: sialate O-acetylesterase, partial [Pedobacter sp.]